MRLSQLYVRQYGPLQKDLTLTPGFNVIRGPNESGKSLLVEALLKQLSDGSVPNPVIDESPEGFVEITAGDATEPLRADDSLLGFCEEQYNTTIRDQELRNVFVIRRGDLTFTDGDEFYSHITDRLTGRRVEDIDEVHDALIDAGRLTPTNHNVSSDQSFHDAGNQLTAAKSLRQDVAEYAETAEQNDLAQIERQYLTAKRREDELTQRLQALERAKEAATKRERHAGLQTRTETLRENVAALAALPAEDELAELDRRLQELSEAKGRQSTVADRNERSISLAKWCIGGAVAAFAVLLLAGFPAVGALSPVAFLLGAGYFWTRARALSEEIAELQVREEQILSDARAAGMSGTDRETLREETASMEAERKALTEQIQGATAVLERELDISADDTQAVLEEADTALDALAADIDDAVDADYDETEHQEVAEALGNVRDEIAAYEDALQAHRERLGEFRERAAELNFSVFLGEPLALEIQNLDSLSTLHDRLGAFVAAIEDDAAASRVAIDIFDEIQAEEQAETAALFEEGSRASEIFRDITDGRYSTVTYDTETNQLTVQKASGERFTPRKLSDGTNDQLYLSIRVALGEQLLAGHTGFFIMDDAFLTADPSRLETQADVVETMAADGWQVVYLSSKEDAISALSERASTDVIDLHPLE